MCVHYTLIGVYVYCGCTPDWGNEMSNLLAYFKPVGKSSPQGSTSNGNARKRPRSLVVDSDSEEEAEVKKVHTSLPLLPTLIFLVFLFWLTCSG